MIMWVFGLMKCKSLLSKFLWLVFIWFHLSAILELNGYYKNPLQKSAFQSIKQYLRALIFIGVLIGGCVVFFQWAAQSRGVLILVFVGEVCAWEEFIVKRFIRAKVQSGKWHEDVLLVGDIDAMRTYKSKIEGLADTGVRIVGKWTLTNGLRVVLLSYFIGILCKEFSCC